VEQLMIYWLIAALGVGGLAALFIRSRRAPTYPDPKSLILPLPMDDERILKLESVPNFRDVGGYTTADGRRVRWRKVYRSGTLSQMTPQDMETIAALGIKLVCDMRSAEEIAQNPERIPLGAQYAHLPLTAENDTIKRLRTLLFNKRKLPLLLIETYTRVLLDSNAPLYGDILRRLAERDNLPALIHCSAGKDRTGIAIALLLLVLGVPEDVVVADYTLSNHYYDSFLTYVGEAIKPIRWLRVKPEDLKPLLLADARSMQAALDHLRTQYGSVELYVKRAAGVDDAVIARLKENLLEGAAAAQAPDQRAPE
jgi:protein-tyrosine phosphatase